MLRGFHPVRQFLLVALFSVANVARAQESEPVEQTPNSPKAATTPSNSESSTQERSAGETGDSKSPPQNPSTSSKPSTENNPESAKRTTRKKTSTAIKPKPLVEDTKGPIVKGVVKGLEDGKLRFESRQFPDIAVGQFFIIEGKSEGEIAARVQVVQVAKNKKISAAKVIKLEDDFQIADLLNRSIYRERDFNSLNKTADLAALVAPRNIVGRNNMIGPRLNIMNSTSTATNLVTGVNLNQTVTWIGPSLEIFLPAGSENSVGNRFGIGLHYLQTVPITVIGRVSGTDETQTLKTSGTEVKFALLYKHRWHAKSLSEFWISSGYQMQDTKAKVETNVGSGDTAITFAQKGPEFGLGGDFSPLPFLYLGAEFNAGIPQKYTGTDSSNSSTRTGSWNQLKFATYAELRYPVGRAKNSLLAIQIKAGSLSESIEIQKGGSSTLEKPLSSFFALRLGFSAG